MNGLPECLPLFTPSYSLAIMSASAASTGMTRPASSSALTRVAPGRVDCPPTSRKSAPESIINRARSNTDATSTPFAPPYVNDLGFNSSIRDSISTPPSLKESGVTLRIPMTRVRSPQLHNVVGEFLYPPIGMTRRRSPESDPTLRSPPTPAHSLAAVAKPALTGSAHIANPPPTPVPASASPL